MLALVAVAVLLAAAAAGAAVQYTIFTIKDGNYARLSGTDINCQNGVSTAQLRSFICNKWIFAGTAHQQAGTYGALINNAGIRVERVTATGKLKTAGEYLHGR